MCDKRLLDVKLIKSFEASEAGFCDFNIIVIVTRGQSGLVHSMSSHEIEQMFQKILLFDF